MNKRMQKKKADSTVGMTRNKLRAENRVQQVLIDSLIAGTVKLEKQVEDLKYAHNLEYAQQEKDKEKLKSRNELLNSTLQDMISYNRDMECENRELKEQIQRLKNRTFLQRVMNKGVDEQ